MQYEVQRSQMQLAKTLDNDLSLITLTVPQHSDSRSGPCHYQLDCYLLSPLFLAPVEAHLPASPLLARAHCSASTEPAKHP